MDRTGGVSDELLEREQELAVLDELVLRARNGEPSLALVEGPPGIGKSRLLAAMRDRARAAGLRTLTARGSDLERGLPFGVVRQLFEPALAAPEDRRRWLSGSALAAARVFDPGEVGSPFHDAGFSVPYGLAWLTTNIAADRPLLLAIDDLQWSDRASLRFIAYLAGRLEGLGIVVVATNRLGEPDVDSRLLGEIAHAPGQISIRPHELSPDAVGTLVTQRLGEDADTAFSAACHRATHGNPLLLIEVLKTMRAERVRPDAEHAQVVRNIGSRAVSRSVLLRLARLPGDAVAVARAVAVLGEGAGLPATAALAELDEARVAQATRSLAAAEILRPESPLGFVHPLVRDAVYLELSSAERELQHERAARALTELEAAPELVATHLLLVPSRSDPWVALVLREAGLAAGRRGDSEIAVTYLRRALAEPPSPDLRMRVLIDLGRAEALANEKAASAEHLAAGLTAIEDPRERGLAAEMLARVMLFTAPPSETAAAARRAAEELGPELDDLRWRLEAIELYTVNFGASVPDAPERLERARSGLRGDGMGARILATVAACDWMMSGGPMSDCCDLVEAALADGMMVAEDPALAPGIAGLVLSLAGRDEVMQLWEMTTAAAHRSGSVLALSGLYVCLGISWLARGELIEAEAALRRAGGLIDPWRAAPAEESYGSAVMALTLVERGELAAARELVSKQPQMPLGSDADGLGRRAEAGLLLAERRWSEVLETTDRYRETLRDRVVNPAWTPWRSLRAEALIGLQRAEEAGELLHEELVWARRWGAAGPISTDLRLLGTVSGKPDLDLLHAAVEVSEGSYAALEHAKALIALGAATRRGRKPSAAREPLRRGLEIASRIGATPLVEHARTELYAAGGRPKRDALTGPDSLTPSERRIAELAAEGLGNREIAQALFVTPRTVEFHLTSVYRKLGISARAGLSQMLEGSASV